MTKLLRTSRESISILRHDCIWLAFALGKVWTKGRYLYLCIYGRRTYSGTVGVFDLIMFVNTSSAIHFSVHDLSVLSLKPS